MQLKCINLLLLALALKIGSLSANEPVAEKRPHNHIKFNQKRSDPYFWLRNKSDPKVIDYLKAENSYLELVLKSTESLQEKLFLEMKAKIKEEDVTAPYKWKDYEYYSKTKAGEEHSQYFRSGAQGEELLINVNDIAKGFDYTYVTFPKFHPDQNLFAYAVDQKGDRFYTLYFRNQKEQKNLDFKIENFTGDFEWADAGKVIYYTKPDETLRADKLYRFDLETQKHTLLYTEKDEKFELALSKSLYGKYIYLTIASSQTSEVRAIQSGSIDGKLKLFSPRKKNTLYYVIDDEERFYIITNDQAENFKVMTTSFEKTEKKNWKEFIPYQKINYIEGILVFKDYLVIAQRKEGLTELEVRKKSEAQIKGDLIKFPDPTYTVSIGSNYEYASSFIRYEFESLNRPYSIFDYSFTQKDSLVVKEKEVKNFKSDEYISERIWAKGHDQKLIPISLVYKKGFQRNSEAPLLAYAYGSYGASTDPYFSIPRLSLLDRGFVYAIIHVRGGSELGYGWYLDGKLLKKKNSFLDFISGVEHLIAEKYSSPQKVFANGGSAGGLLMGGVLNLKPELFTGVIADVPFVDVVTTMLDSTIPLTTGEYEEWGNPNEKKFYNYMLSYSPYDNIAPKAYPHIMVTTGLNDTQVPYWEPAKMVAKLRDQRTDKSKILVLKTEMEVGHGGKNGRYDYLKEDAISFAFIFKILGIDR